MGNNKALEVLRALQNISSRMKDKNNIEEEMKKIEKEFQVSSKDLIDLYNKMEAFRMEIENMGGMSAYESSNVTWLKSELELLFAAYQFCQQQGVKVSEISFSLSKAKLNIFPKTESQLQNTYYKLKKEEIPFEMMIKQKPGRKRKEPGEMKAAVEVVETREATSQHNSSDLVSLLSGIVENFETIGAKSKKKKQLYHLMEGIYNLSSVAATRTKNEIYTGNLQYELEALREENGRLQREKEELIMEMKDVTDNLIHFITSSDIEQIRSLPSFVKTCKGDLHKLGLYNGARDNNMEIIVDRWRPVVPVTQ